LAGGARLLGRRIESRLCGGTEVTGFADYSTGDDFRYVDWNRCARHDELLSKQFRGTEDRRTYLLIDCSASMAIREGLKLQFAKHMAAILGHMALRGLDAVGGLTFAGVARDFLPACRGPQHLAKWLQFCERATAADLPHTKSTDLLAATRALIAGTRRPGLTIIISDLLSGNVRKTIKGQRSRLGLESALDLLRRHNFEPYVIHVLDEFDAEPALLGRVQLADVESNSQRTTRLTPEDLKNYRAVVAEFTAHLKRYCYRYSIGLSLARAQAPVQLAVQHCLADMMFSAQRSIASRKSA